MNRYKDKRKRKNIISIEIYKPTIIISLLRPSHMSAKSTTCENVHTISKNRNTY